MANNIIAMFAVSESNNDESRSICSNNNNNNNFNNEDSFYAGADLQTSVNRTEVWVVSLQVVNYERFMAYAIWWKDERMDA